MSVWADLSHRVVLVTGAAGGLGLAVAEALAAAGATPVLSDLKGERLEATVKSLQSLGGTVFAVPADLSDAEQAAGLPAAAAEIAGRLDGAVNAAGLMQTLPMSALSHEDWTRVIGVNLTGSFHVLQAAGNYLAAHDGGSVVTVASVAARSGRPNAAHYAASKTALLSLTKSAAMAYAPLVRFNAVCPGIFLTSMWQSIIADRDREFGEGAGQEYLDRVISQVPLGRVGDAAELASVVLFLLSDLSSYVTGQAFNVDGGLEMD